MTIKDFCRKSKKIIFNTIRIYTSMPWITMETSAQEDMNVWKYIFHVENDKKEMRQRNVGVMVLPSSFEEYKQGKSKQAFRTNYNKAERSNYSCRFFNGIDYFDDIMEINLSEEERAGRKMDRIYTDATLVREFLEKQPLLFGCFYGDKLVAYFNLIFAGPQCTLNKIIGHKDYLPDGIMYFLLGKLIQFLLEERKEIRYIMYGCFYTGESSAGVFYYKQRTGFEGYNISYQLKV